MNELQFSLPNLTADGEEIPELGEPGNEWLGAERLVHGQKQFHAYSGAERNRIRRLVERAKRAEQVIGQRRHNRKERQNASKADTRRMQLRILTGDIKVPMAMFDSLQSGVEAEKRRIERAETAPARRATADFNREQALDKRRAARFAAEAPRGKDLRPDTFRQYEHLLPEGYAGKRPS